MSMAKKFQNLEDEAYIKYCHERQGKTIVLGWSAQGIGFGEVLLIEHVNGTVEVDAEGMGKEFAKQTFAKIIDSAVESEDVREEVNRRVTAYLQEEGRDPYEDSDHASFLREDIAAQVRYEYFEASKDGNSAKARPKQKTLERFKHLASLLLTEDRLKEMESIVSYCQNGGGGFDTDSWTRAKSTVTFARASMDTLKDWRD